MLTSAWDDVWCEDSAQSAFEPTLMGDLRLVTAPTGEVLFVDEIKRQIRLTHTSMDDDYLQELIPAVEEMVEISIPGHRQLRTATYDLPLRSWWDGELRLPRPPLQSVTSVQYYATDGTLTTSATTGYEVIGSWRGQGTILRAPDQIWPSLQTDRRYPVVIRFVAGYASAAAVPATLKHAMKLLAAFWYENREAFAEKRTEEVGNPGFSLSSLLALNGYGSYA